MLAFASSKCSRHTFWQHHSHNRKWQYFYTLYFRDLAPSITINSFLWGSGNLLGLARANEPGERDAAFPMTSATRNPDSALFAFLFRRKEPNGISVRLLKGNWAAERVCSGFRSDGRQPNRNLRPSFGTIPQKNLSTTSRIMSRAMGRPGVADEIVEGSFHRDRPAEKIGVIGTVIVGGLTVVRGTRGMH